MPSPEPQEHEFRIAFGDLHDRLYRPDPVSPMPEAQLLGFRLPVWQRPAVWRHEQQVAFLESAWLGYGLGQIVVTERNSLFLGRQDPLDRLLIDGQQRLGAIQTYFQDGLEVFGACWSEVHPEDQARLLITVTLGLVRLGTGYDEASLRAKYVRLNYGGTPHAPEHHPEIWRR